PPIPDRGRSVVFLRLRSVANTNIAGHESPSTRTSRARGVRHRRPAPDPATPHRAFERIRVVRRTRSELYAELTNSAYNAYSPKYRQRVVHVSSIVMQ